MSTTMTVFFKEVRDAIRDRRTIAIALLLGPLLMPILMVGMTSVMAGKQKEKLEKPLNLPVLGVEHAPNLVEWLRQHDVDIKPAPKDPDAAIRNQDFDVILRIPKTYAEEWRSGEPAALELIYDSARPMESGTSIGRARALLSAYGDSVGKLRLLARGVNPMIASPIVVTGRDMATPEGRKSLGLMILPYILLLTGFLGGMQMAIDLTAGERERQSLEPLLATPATRESIMSGKMLATCAIAVASLILTLVSFKITGMMAAGSGGAQFAMSVSSVAKIFLIVFPIVLFGSCLLTLLAANSKSTREAQSYSAFLMLLPMIPTMYMMVAPVKTQTWMLAVPFMSQNQMIMKVLRNEPISATDWGVCLGASLLLVAIIWWLAAKLYHREQLAISG